MPKLRMVYALEEPPESFSKSIFLAGPAPRDKDVQTWRRDAIRKLQELGFDGVVFIPEDRSGVWHGDQRAQIEWEERCLHMSDSMLIWVPRNMEAVPALMTNVEFGCWEDSGRVVFGSPQDAVRNDHLVHYAGKLGIPATETLEGLVSLALDMIGDGAARTDGEREVPLYVWKTDSFQRWYGNLKSAGTDSIMPGWSGHFGLGQASVSFFTGLSRLTYTSRPRSVIRQTKLFSPARISPQLSCTRKPIFWTTASWCSFGSFARRCPIATVTSPRRLVALISSPGVTRCEWRPWRLTKRRDYPLTRLAFVSTKPVKWWQRCPPTRHTSSL